MVGTVVALGSNVLRVLPLSLRAAVVACVALVAAPALAQPTAQQVADGAVARVRQATQTTIQHIVGGKNRAVAGIEALDLQGASNQRIIAFGNNAVDALQRMGQAGRNRIETITRNAVAALNGLQAPQALIDQVLAAAQTGRQAINQAQQRAVSAVRDAVAEAIGPP